MHWCHIYPPSALSKVLLQLLGDGAVDVPVTGSVTRDPAAGEHRLRY